MKEREPNPYAELAFLQVDKAKEPMPPKPKPAPHYQSLSILTFAIQMIYLVLSTLTVFGVATNFSLFNQVDEAKNLQALLQNPPPGTDRSQLISTHENLITAAAKLKQSSDSLLVSTVTLFAFSNILALALIGWTAKATANLRVLGVPKLVYSPLIAALGMFFVPLFTAGLIFDEIVKGSDPERLTPYGHREQGVSLLAVAWWLSMVISTGATLFLLFQIPTDQELEAGQRPSSLLMILTACICPLHYLLGFWLVGSIHTNQLARLEVAQNPPPRPEVAVTPEFG